MSDNNNNNNPVSSSSLLLQQELWPTEASLYHLIGKVGQGAFATVWKAQKLNNNNNNSTTTTNYSLQKSSSKDSSGTDSDNKNVVAVTTSTDKSTTTTTTTTTTEDIVGGVGDDGSTTTIHYYYCGVKILNLDHVDTNLAEIRSEVQAMRLLCHPNILPCLTAFVVDRYLWLVTPLMTKGSSLYCLQSARRLLLLQQKQQHQQQFNPINDSSSSSTTITSMEPHIMYILHETLLGLQYIHENGQIHRDIKAGNILLDGNGDVKIADFGVSGWLVQSGSFSRQEKAKTFVGTPCWMAPEVMEQIHGYDYKADIWSLGITALELARGYAPYAKYAPMKVLILTIQETPPSLLSYDTNEDMDDCHDLAIQYAAQEQYTKQIFEHFVTKCLQKNPSKRPTCKDLLTSCPYFTNYTATSTTTTTTTTPTSTTSTQNANNLQPLLSYREIQREAFRSEVCSLVPDVGSSQQSPTYSQRPNHRMPGNTPVSIFLNANKADENRPAGTTWVFADGTSSSQDLSAVFGTTTGTAGNGKEDGDGTTTGSGSGSGSGGGGGPHNVDDVLSELDEFGKQTGGEHYTTASNSTMNDATIRTGTGVHNNNNNNNNNNTPQQLQPQEQGQQERHIEQHQQQDEQQQQPSVLKQTDKGGKRASLLSFDDEDLLPVPTLSSGISTIRITKSDDDVLQQHPDHHDHHKCYNTTTNENESKTQEQTFILEQIAPARCSEVEELNQNDDENNNNNNINIKTEDDNNNNEEDDDDDDLDDFMNEFEQTTGGEDFRRSITTTTSNTTTTGDVVVVDVLLPPPSISNDITTTTMSGNR